MNLSLNGKNFSIRTHKLVAQAFLPNLNNYREINHKDSNKQNNCVDNLEWCSRSRNMQQVANEVYSGKRELNFYLDIYCYKPITGEFVAKFCSLVEAIAKMDFSKKTRCGIASIFRGEALTAKGYLWSLKKLTSEEVQRRTLGRNVVCPMEDFYGYSNDGKTLVFAFHGFRELKNKMGENYAHSLLRKLRKNNFSCKYKNICWSLYPKEKK